MENTPESLMKSLHEGRNVIRRYASDMPDTPGVYRMLDASGAVLYVGKAKNLRNRVVTYVNVAALNTRIQKMISQTASMEITTTRSEAEASGLAEGSRPGSRDST